MSDKSRIIKMIKPYGAFVAASLFLAVIGVVGSLYAPVLSGEGVDLIVAAGQVDHAGIARIAAVFIVVVIITSASQYLMELANNHISYGVVRDFRIITFRKLEKLPISYLDSHKPGDIISRFTTDAEQFADGLLMGLSQLFSGILRIVITLVLLVTIEWRIAVVVVILTPISVVVSRFIAGKSYHLFISQSESRSQMTAFSEEYVGEAHTMRAFGYEKRAEKRFCEINSELAKKSLKAVFFSSLTNPVTRFVNSIVYAVVGVIGAWMAIRGNITVGQLIVVLSYANQYTRPFNDISTVMTELQNAVACAARLFEFADEKEETPDGAVKLEQSKGCINFRHVEFGYPGGQAFIKDLNIDMAPGEHVALVGRTGCGKTTLINMLMRFYDPISGEIVIDGVATSDMNRDSLRSEIAMVLQDTWLKEGTVAENIAYGMHDKSRDEIELAAKKAGADYFIKRLPKGYDTFLEEGGAVLSEGQRQLICIARAMLKDAPILILDEATSSIDTRTEVLVQRAFDELMKGRSSLVVAHRISTIQNADRILVMDGGKIIEQGTHAELLDMGGLYAELYKSQFAGENT